MTEMRRSVKQKVVAAAAVALLLAGGSIAAVSATGQSNPRRHGAHRRAHRARAHELAAAASYLGVSPTQLAAELRGGKSLAQVADAIPGKSSSGLIGALVATRKAKLAAAAAKVPQRVAVEVNRAGGPAAGGPLNGSSRAGRRAASGAARIVTLFASPKALGTVAAGYLGVDAAQLQSDLRAGRSLAQVADATAGKSQAGLVAALLAARRSGLAGAVVAGRLTPAQRDARAVRLQKHVSAFVQRKFAGATSA
jgi:hypothetical protein